MRVFVTGANGYIGFAVCQAVKRRGHDVVGLARSANAIEKLLAAGIHPVQGTLEEHGVLREMTHDADAVIHCAFEATPQGPRIEARALDTMLNAIDTEHEAFVYTSGTWVYGDTGGTSSMRARRSTRRRWSRGVPRTRRKCTTRASTSSVRSWYVPDSSTETAAESRG